MPTLKNFFVPTKCWGDQRRFSRKHRPLICFYLCFLCSHTFVSTFASSIPETSTLDSHPSCFWVLYICRNIGILQSFPLNLLSRAYFYFTCYKSKLSQMVELLRKAVLPLEETTNKLKNYWVYPTINSPKL